MQEEQQGEEGGMGLISNCKDFIFCCVYVVTDLDFGNMAPWDAAIMPAWSLSKSAVCSGDLWAEGVVGEPSTGEGGPLRSSPYTVPSHTLFKCHRDGGHPSPRHHRESSAHLVLGRDGFGCPPSRGEPSLLPSGIHKAHLPAPWTRPVALHAAFPSCRAHRSPGLQVGSF